MRTLYDADNQGFTYDAVRRGLTVRGTGEAPRGVYLVAKV